MAFRTWAKLIAATLGVGALAGASQLGLAYGLGIVRLTRVVEVTARDQWTAQLTWVTWFAMLAAVLGAVGGAALLRQWSPESSRPGIGTELALALAAAAGAAVVVPLTMQPARTAQVYGVNPVLVIAICTGIGALAGVFAAWAAVAQAVARWSFVTTGIVVWVIAVVSVAPSLAPGDPLPAVRLGVVDAAFLPASVTQRTALATMPALALLIGVTLGWLARRRELPTLTIALAGLPGAALLTLAYLIAGPGAGADRYQVVPYWAAMTAAGAGVLGSVLVAVLRRTSGPDDADDADDDEDMDDDGYGERDAAAPPLPLPQRTDRKKSAIAAAGTSHSADAPARPTGAAATAAAPASGRPGGAGRPTAGAGNDRPGGGTTGPPQAAGTAGPAPAAARRARPGGRRSRAGAAGEAAPPTPPTVAPASSRPPVRTPARWPWPTTTAGDRRTFRSSRPGRSHRSRRRSARRCRSPSRSPRRCR